ncbi:autotransporter assembly complex family protein [Actimicrobium antarcticum]|uniref:Autotransporter assembly complex family protein n=1 Tax=Actimicrobium antarcticum TaxID=1051899 RepID=A0ABP7U138_9BURK
MAQSSSAAYTLEITGAGPLTRLLNDFLDIRQHASDADIAPDELQRLAGAAPQQVRELLATEGYFAPAIRQEIITTGTRPLVRIEVDPGQPTVVDAVDIQFAGAIAEDNDVNARRSAILRRQWSLAKGAIFRQGDWDNAKGNLLKNLLSRDYPAASLPQSEARIDPQRHTATLTVEADSGPAFTFGPLQVQGLKRYPRSRIDVLNPLQPNEPYSQDRLNELQARLQDSGYFKSVFATIDVNPEQPLTVPVRVDVTENQRRRLSLGGGFSTDTGPRLQAKFLDRNFLSRDWRLESELRIDRSTPLLAAEVTLPPISNGWTPSVGGRFERTDISGEISDRLRTDARLTSPDKNNEQAIGVSYLVENQRIDGNIANNRHALIATHAYTRRRVDNLLDPRRGYVAAIELGVGVRGLMTEQSLVRVLGRVTWLEPWTRQWKTVVRAQIGQVFGASRDSVPGDLLFRTGGDQTVRGYGYNSLGVSENNAVVGGRVMALLSTELVYQLTPQWGAAVFNDAGNAADSWRDFKVVMGTGVGARWRSPIGPVNLDLAYAHETRQPRLHFSIGYGF